MTPEQMRKRLAEISNSLKAFEGLADFSDEQIKEIGDLNAEFKTLTAKLEAHETVQAMRQQLDQPQRVVPPAAPAAPAASRSISVGSSAEDRYFGFKNGGEYFLAARQHGMGGKSDERLLKASIAHEKNGEDGGFAVPEDINLEIQKKLQSDDSLLARTRQFRTSGNAMSILVDETKPWTAGIRAYWIEEGGNYTPSKPKLSRAAWRLHKLGALVQPTDELLEDATAMESYIRVGAPEAIMYEINNAIIGGSGVGQPTGILGSSFRVVVPKEDMQAADTIQARNVLKMYARMIPQALNGAAWYCNAGVQEQLMTLKDDNGNFLYLAPGSQMNQTPYATLLGKPLFPMIGTMPALGDEGDLVFANLEYWWALLKSAGVKQAVSTHFLFDRDVSAFKFTLRIDGKTPFSAPITTEKGNFTMSAIVTLETR